MTTRKTCIRAIAEISHGFYAMDVIIFDEHSKHMNMISILAMRNQFSCDDRINND